MKNILKDIAKNRIKILQKNKTNHALVNGDSSDILEKISDKSIDLIFADPPYNANLKYGKYYNDNLSWNEYYKQTHKWFKEYKRILKPTGSLYLINYPEVNARLLPYFEDTLKLKLKRWITWHYPTNIGHSNKNFTRSQRAILFFTKSNKYIFNKKNILQQYKNPEVKKVKKLIESGSKGRVAYDMLSLLDIIDMKFTEGNKNLLDVHDINLLKNVSKNRLTKQHPCQLPFELIRRFIKVSTNKNNIILDPFAGTFSTSLIAAELGRNSIGIEINPNYVKLGHKRFKKLYVRRS